MSGFIYLINSREFNNIKEPTYKIGRSNDIHRRYKEYPKDSILLYSCVVNNEIKLEKLIIKQFKIDFIQKKEYGNEYFKGDHTKMIKIINNIINEHDDEVAKQPDMNVIESFNKMKILNKQLIALLNKKDILMEVYFPLPSYDFALSDQTNKPEEFETISVDPRHRSSLNELNDSITGVLVQIIDLMSDTQDTVKKVEPNITYKCEFGNICTLCKTNCKNKIYCSHICYICPELRNEKKKLAIKYAKESYNNKHPKTFEDAGEYAKYHYNFAKSL